MRLAYKRSMIATMAKMLSTVARAYIFPADSAMRSKFSEENIRWYLRRIWCLRDIRLKVQSLRALMIRHESSHGKGGGFDASSSESRAQISAEAL